MLNFAMYSDSICLETMHKNNASLKVSFFESQCVYTHLTIEQLVCVVKLSLSKDCCISDEAFLFL